MSDNLNARPASKTSCLVLRVPLGLVFLYSAAVKLWQWPRFAQHVGEFGIVLDSVVKPTAAVVCFLELVIGVGILFHAKWALPATIALLIAFIAVLSYGIVIGLDIECGCFGTGHSFSLNNQLLIDVVIVVWTFCAIRNCSHAE